MNKISNFKNRFRILKGGKVSLVVSAMLLSSTVFVNSANAAPVCNQDANPLTCERTTQKAISDGSDYTIETNGSIVLEYLPRGINISNAQNGQTITNNGLISVNNNGFSNTLGIVISGNNGGTVTLNNTGKIESLQKGIFNFLAYSILVNGDPLLNINNSGTLRGNIHGSTINLKNTGIVELPVSGITIMKTFENESSGKLIIGLKTDGQLGAGTEYSRVFTDSAIFKNNSTIGVNVLDSSTNVELLAGSKLTNVLKASQSLTIDGKLNITDNSALLDFEYETTASNGEDSWGGNGEDGSIHLNVVKAKDGGGGDKTILSETKAGNGNQNSQNAAVALQGVYDNSPDIASAFNKLPTDSSIAKAVESTTPLATTSSVGAGSQIANGISTIV
uniref:hypothetical protein n=1 Tax=Aliarcobacter cryaerophilus TaxID=28198 RepID=UPI0011DF396B